MKTKCNPLISIIIPVYNVAQYLSYSLESAREQSYKNLEIVLVDDGSSDDSYTICSCFCNVDNRFRLVHQENRGVSAARNRGLEICKGDYILFMDADDYIHPRMIEILYKTLSEGDCSFSMALYRKVYGFRKNYEHIEYSCKEMNRYQLMRSLYGNSRGDLDFRVCGNKLFPRELIKDISFTNTVSEDLEFNNRVFLKSSKAAVVNQRMYYYMQRNGSITHSGYRKRDIDALSSYLLCLREIPAEMSRLRALCLIKLYKTLLSVSHFSKDKELSEYAQRQKECVLSLTYNEFIGNTYIPFAIKNFLLLAYYMPLFYSLFIWKCELSAKLVSRKH